MVTRYCVVLFCLLVLSGSGDCGSDMSTTSVSNPPATVNPPTTGTTISNPPTTATTISNLLTTGTTNTSVEKGGCGALTPQRVVLLLPCLVVFYQSQHLT